MLFPLPTAYEDMTYLPSGSERPNARSLSNDLFTGQTGLPSNNNWTSLFAHFGKFVSMEISHTLDSACPTEILQVPIFGGDPDFDDNATIEDHIPYERIAYDIHSGLSPNNPRRQVNLATSLIDASVVYGNSEVWANALRDWHTGKLKSSDQISQFPAMNEYRLPIGSFPFSNSDIYPDPTKYWQFGDPNSHENPALLTLSVLFFRWHNFLVKQTADASLSKEDLFYKARSKVIATLQKIILYDWLPLLLDEKIEPYKEYNPNVDPGLSSLYDAVAMNYYLTLIPPILMPRNKKCQHLQTIRLCGCFWNSQAYLTNESHSFDSIILGMVSQLAEQDDMVVSSDFKGKYFGTMSYSRQDCIVQTIMKGRDLGLPDYNSARVALGMKKIEDWKDINPKMFKRHPQLLQKFKSMHNNSLNNIDIFTGAMMETTETGPGEFIKKLTKDQFLRIRDVCILFMCLLKQYRIKLYRAFLEDTKTFKKSFRRSYHRQNNIHKAYEWIEYPESFNKVDINFNSIKGSLDLKSGNKILRSVTFNNMETVDVSLTTDKKRTFLLLKVPKEYDLILEFINDFDRCEFSKELEQVISKTRVVRWFYIKQKELMKSAVTRKKRTKMLEAFLKSVFSEAFHLDYDPSLDHVEFKQTKELLEFEMTKKYSPFRSKLKHLRHFLENNKQHIFFIILFYAVTCGLFAERFYYYTVEREKSGLRQIMSYGLSVTRGAAAGMSFTYSLLLITMCRNFITFLRGTFLNLYIPFDSHVAFHKIVAWTALAFTAFHVVGYGFNFYHIAMQPTKIFCVFKSIHFRTDFMPKFYWWLFGNLTGMTGVLLTILIIVIYIFATQMSRRYIFKAFWLTHKLIIPLYILAVLHGSSVLVQKPMFWCYFIGPVIAFVIDKMISLSRKRTEISVVRAEKLPSDVSFLEFKRPTNFEYKSGQWVRIACDSLGKNEFHPFTLTSAPHEDTLSVHIRALGPWTSKIREIFNPENLKEQPYPKLYVDGPYGAGQQDWYRFDVSILVGAGIGVTPYAAILKDFVHMNAMKNTYKIKCQKVHFIWVTGSHRHFEWLIDILQEVEQIDTKGIVSIDIFITKFFQHYDLRTAMLYICEEYFQKHFGGRSVFTGLKAKTHFGRPQLGVMMKSIHQENPYVRTVGVFSCGPPGMTKSVEAACNDASKSTKALFKHHFENF
ncbi:DUOX [Acanthosepion pharaonis]|uniref:DUOX n=1 Tax=Acanthosepion pharaonis TaxID=158019 RepID=A0A812EC16_ACAPH|nr:DUOX [Sepia pharaonis]